MPTIVIAHNDRDQRQHWAAQLDADGHNVYDANTVRNTLDTLTQTRTDVLLLGALQRPSEAPQMLTDIRAGRVDVAASLAVLTLGPTDQVTQLRAYDAGADHHLALDIDYLILRAVIGALLRRNVSAPSMERPQLVSCGVLSIDGATREVRLGDQLVSTTKREFDLLRTLAEDPTRVFTKHELRKLIWGDAGGVGTTRTLDSHACRLRRKLAKHGAHLIHAQWGVGYRLTDRA